MSSWRTAMPKGMFLKSEGCASNLSEPSGRYTLERYCADTAAPYKPWAFPVSLDLFTRYGLWFQAHLVPELEEKRVLACAKHGSLFRLELEDGEAVDARQVIVATGIASATRVPGELGHLPKEAVSHSSAHVEFESFRSRDIIVIGAGQSALETAALLHESGAKVRVIARRKSIVWNTDGTERRSLIQRIRRPMTPLGGGLRTWLYVNAPGVFYSLPESVRVAQVKNSFGPAGAWWLRSRVEGQIPMTLGCELRDAALSGDRVVLRLARDGEPLPPISADHVIAATGYEITRRSFPFMAGRLMDEVRCTYGAPALSRNFESSVGGLYFVGLASAYHYGPIMRFVFGAQQTATRIAECVAGRCQRGAMPQAAAARADQRPSTFAGARLNDRL